MLLHVWILAPETPNPAETKYAESNGDARRTSRPLRVCGCSLSIPASTIEHVIAIYAENRYTSSMDVGDFDSAPRPGTAMLSREMVRLLALEAGFTEAGVVELPHAAETRDASRFAQWIRAGSAGTMKYLSRTGEDEQLMRGRVGIPFPWARSAVVCFANYHAAGGLSTEKADTGAGWIARYAWTSRVDAAGMRRPSDYHKVLLKRLRALETRLQETVGTFESRAYVDTGPVMERALATAAALGWTGKNTCLIHPKLGSFGFLAVLLTSLRVADERVAAVIPDRCGSCTRCLEACPTGALTAPYQMDATRCISYLTIEHKGSIAPELMEGMGRQVFGCDICQDVCPWNRKAPVSTDGELEARPELINPALEWLADMDEGEFERTFNGSPVRRAGFPGLRRNVAVAMGNSGVAGFAPQLRRWAEAADEGLRSAARWALEKLTP
jgi:epoxyqueuosine reductase